MYRTTLHRDGTLSDARMVGGTRNAPLDNAVVAAIVALDTSRMLSPPDSLAMGRLDTLTLRIAVGPTTMSHGSEPLTNKTPGLTALVRLRVPARRSQGPMPNRNNRPPTYPYQMRKANIEGETLFEFVIDANGVGDLSTVQVLRTTALPFVQATLEAFPDLRFEPMTIDGCPVAALAYMPFMFSLTR